MDLEILGQGSALPKYWIGPEESVRYATDYFCETDEQRQWVPVLYSKAGVNRRYSVLLDGPETTGSRHSAFPVPKDGSDLGPSVGYRMRLYERECGPLAVSASREAIERSGLSAGDITHLITISCSGFYAPGVDVAVIKELEERKIDVYLNVNNHYEGSAPLTIKKIQEMLKFYP